MNSKVYAIFAILLVGSQVIAGSHFIYESTPEYYIKESRVLDYFIKAALKSDFNFFQALAEDTIKQGLIDIQAEVETALAEIVAIRQQAEQLGQNIEGSIEGQVAEVQQLAVTLGDNLRKCVTGLVNIINTDIADMEDFWDVLINENQSADSIQEFISASDVGRLRGDNLRIQEAQLKLCSATAASQANAATSAILANIGTYLKINQMNSIKKEL